MTQEQREHHTNGIWLCRNCGTLVDDDEGGFPVEMLVEWKTKAHAERRANVVAPAQRITPTSGQLAETSLARNNDVKRYEEFMDEFPSTEGMIVALRSFNAASAFSRTPLLPLDDLLRDWTTPERAFADLVVRTAMRQLTMAAGSFLGYMSVNTWPTKHDVRWSHVPPEWKDTQPERYKTTVAALDAFAEEVVRAHAAFIETARRELGI